MTKPIIKRCPKLIIEGTRLTGKTELALALNQHSRIVGVRKYRYHSPIVSAIWSSFTVITRGSLSASTSQRRCGRLSIAARNTALTGWSRASHLSVSGLFLLATPEDLRQREKKAIADLKQAIAVRYFSHVSPRTGDHADSRRTLVYPNALS